MTQETAIAAALRRAGFETGSRLHAVIVGCLRDEGGDRARAAKSLSASLVKDSEIRDHLAALVVNAVAGDMAGTPVGGHIRRAEDGQRSPSPDRRQNAGANLIVPEGQVRVAPAREPSSLQIEAMKRGRRKSAVAISKLGWMEKRIIPNGPRIVDATVGSLGGFIERMKREGLDRMHLFYVLRRIKDEIDSRGVAPAHERWTSILPADVIERIAAETEPDRVAEEAKEFVARLGLTAFQDALEHRHAG